MKIYMTICICLALFLVGCGEESNGTDTRQTHNISQDRLGVPPEANAENCSPDMKSAILNDLGDEASRDTFIADCRSFDQRKRLTSGTFMKSPPGDY